MKTALITGGTRGIGKAIAFEFLKRGYEVVINYSSDEGAAIATQAEFNMLGYCPVLMRADVSDEAQVEEMFSEIFRLYDRLDVLVNNAGISRVNVIQDTSAAEWDRVFAVNARGTFLCSRAVTDKMIGAGGGAIINVSSIWGEVGASCEVAYSASKAAVIGFTKALAKELGPSQIQVNCIAPGVIDTDMNAAFDEETMQSLRDETPLGRIGTPKDIAKAALFLASEQSDFITGQVLGVNGGMIV